LPVLMRIRSSLVRFEGENPERPERIIVEDHGSGMGLKTVVRSG